MNEGHLHAEARQYPISKVVLKLSQFQQGREGQQKVGRNSSNAFDEEGLTGSEHGPSMLHHSQSVPPE